MSLIVRMFFSGFVCLGGGWALYCMTPAGSAERNQSRQQQTNQFREQTKRK